MSEQKLLMDDTELSISFRKAKNKREQIGVLADLNLCAPYVIAERLENLGLLTGTGLIPENFSRKYDAVSSATLDRKPMKHRYPDKRAARSVEPMDELRAMELFKDGLDDLQMAETLDVSPTHVKHWRQRMHLLRPRGGGRPRKKKTEETEMKPTTENEQEQPMTEDLPNATEEMLTVSVPTPNATEEMLTVSEFLATVTELLTPLATKAGLIINGSPVTAIAALHIRVSDMPTLVEIVTEG